MDAIKGVPDSEKPDFLQVIRYGRPCWYSQLLSGQSPQEMIDLAIAKMRGGRDMYPDGAQKFEVDIALASSRLALSAAPQSQLAHLLVGAYCASPLAISADCTTLYPFYPSDPLLMEAAARATEKATWVSLIDAVRKEILSGAVLAGERGEMVGRIITLIGMDIVQQNCGVFSHPNTNVCTDVAL